MKYSRKDTLNPVLRASVRWTFGTHHMPSFQARLTLLSSSVSDSNVGLLMLLCLLRFNLIRLVSLGKVIAHNLLLQRLYSVYKHDDLWHFEQVIYSKLLNSSRWRLDLKLNIESEKLMLRPVRSVQDVVVNNILMNKYLKPLKRDYLAVIVMSLFEKKQPTEKAANSDSSQ